MQGDFKTYLRTSVFPAIPGKKAAGIMSLLYQFDQTQWLSAEELEVRQRKQLARLYNHALRTVPHYRKTLMPAGRKDIQDKDFWLSVPILKRSDVQAAGTFLQSKKIPPDHGPVGDVYTSGTTGKPIRVFRTALTGLFWCSFTIRDHLWQGRDFSGKFASIRSTKTDREAYPKGLMTSSWGTSSLVFDTGPGAALDINATPEQQLEWLQREAPDYIQTHPTNLKRLVEYASQNNIRLPSLKQVSVISEVLAPEVRALCRDTWDVGVSDMYTSREVGYMALQCPDHEHFHVQSEGVLLEVLDKDDKLCQPGEIGRVVVTPLHNFANPLIRYEIGDYAEVGEPCTCGRGHPVLKRIMGREQNMLILPDGGERWTLLSSDKIGDFLSLAPVRQYQFAQISKNQIEVRLVVDRDLNKDEEAKLSDWVTKQSGHPFQISFVYLNEIPAPNGKYQDFVREFID